MKNAFKHFGIIAFVVVIGFSVVSCLSFTRVYTDNDYEMFNGDWDNTGQYVVTFKDGEGVFKQLYGSFWLDAYKAGYISIGEQCFRNFVKSGEGRWTGQVRTYYYLRPYETLGWLNCTITLSADGQTLEITASGIEPISLIKK